MWVPRKLRHYITGSLHCVSLQCVSLHTCGKSLMELHINLCFTHTSGEPIHEPKTFQQMSSILHAMAILSHSPAQDISMCMSYCKGTAHQTCPN